MTVIELLRVPCGLLPLRPIAGEAPREAGVSPHAGAAPPISPKGLADMGRPARAAVCAPPSLDGTESNHSSKEAIVPLSCLRAATWLAMIEDTSDESPSRLSSAHARS